ncbi:MAG TPA: hypothetical protein VJ901_21925 [Thermoanaerobaculia bacterium]|nr:hypothetical protein [Thermoanaerobaculia bacterium]
MQRSRVVLFVVLSLAAIVPLRNYDLFWHLATGRWIVEHRALPASDPFAVASDRGPWINGEWLFDVAIAPIGFNALTILRALIVAAMFAFATRDPVIASIAFAGANPLCDMRPSTIGAAFAAMAIAIARRSWIAFAILTAVWINVHPSALLAPVIMLVLTRSIPHTFASFAALFVNPFGWRAIAAPVSLNAFVTSGAIANAEWQRSSPLVFPILYITIVAGVVLLWRKRAELVLFAMFAILAILHVRHQPLYFAAMPLLFPSIDWKKWATIVTAAIITLAFFTIPHGLGLLDPRWPIAATARLKSTQLKGNIYNPDQFGGLLIWSFYPERRALTDGRNELYRTYNAEYAVAHNDESAWRALLAKYKIDLALDEYRRERVTVVDAITKQKTRKPASLVYWPRAQWALIGYDDVGMLFVRRAAFPPEVLQRWELRDVVPDAR